MSVQNTVSAAFDRAQLQKSFSKVPVGLKLLGGPINTGSRFIDRRCTREGRSCIRIITASIWIHGGGWFATPRFALRTLNFA
jgi:hypothetical protein